MGLILNLDVAVALLLDARSIAARASLGHADIADIQRLVADSRLVPVIISLHELAALRTPLVP